MNNYFKYNEFNLLEYLERLLDLGLVESITQISNNLYDVRFGFIETDVCYEYTQNIPDFIWFKHKLNCNYILVYGGLIINQDAIVKKGYVYHTYEKKNSGSVNVIPQMISLSDKIHIYDIFYPNDDGMPHSFYTPIFIKGADSAKIYVKCLKCCMDNSVEDIYDEHMCTPVEFNADNYIEMSEIEKILKNSTLQKGLDNKLKCATIITDAITSIGSNIVKSCKYVSESVRESGKMQSDALYSISDSLQETAFAIKHQYRFK